MNNTLKYAALAVFVGATGVAQADPAETKGGIKVKTEDGRFEATIGGRIQFDAYAFDQDKDAGIGANQATKIGTGQAQGQNRGGTGFRRAYLTLTGKAYGWDYKFENDFTATTANGGAFREMWIGTKVGPGKLIIGQHKPFRGMEELTSSNEITLMERPVTSASGIYGGNRQFLTGLFYKGNSDTFGYGAHISSLSGGTGNFTEGNSYGARAYWFPMSGDGETIHAGLAYSTDREDVTNGTASSAAVSYSYAGRRGLSMGFGNAGSRLASGFGKQNTLHAELGASFGSFTAQAEYATAELENSFGASAATAMDSDVDAYYLQGSYFVTGEKKVYKKDRGAFGSPKPINDFGAVELVARYEVIENKDESGTNAICSLPGTTAANATFSKCELNQITLGANWYVNPNVRFMLNYYLAEADVGTGKDEPEALSLRAQFGF